MKVLLATWTWFPVGGDWTYVENVKTLYENNGYEVIPFSTKNIKNVSNKYENYFVNSYDYKSLNAKKSLSNSFKAIKNAVVSFDALNKIDALLDEHEIDLAHLHIIHHWVTPAIIWKLKKRNIPIVWSLHEYKLLCPEGTFVSNETVCEKCYNQKFYNCALNKCKKQSFSASLLASIDAYFYNYTKTYDKVDFFLCPSEFLMNKFIEFGYNPSKMKLTNYCYDISFLDSFISNNKHLLEQNEATNGKYILYVGRIEKLKGIKTLISAVEGTNIKLKIAGTGSALDYMKDYVNNRKLTNIEFLGFQSKQSVYELTIKSLAVVCPSEWYENYPFSVIESLLLSKPVVGSRIGGIPELVIDGLSGYLHEPGDFNDLRNKLSILWNDDELAKRLGKQAREYAYSKVNFNSHWQILSNIIGQIK